MQKQNKATGIGGGVNEYLKIEIEKIGIINQLDVALYHGKFKDELKKFLTIGEERRK